MAPQDQPTSSGAPTSAHVGGVDRRRLLKGAAAAAGATFAAPVLIDRFATPAYAAGSSGN